MSTSIRAQLETRIRFALDGLKLLNPNASVMRGLRQIHAEMGAVADVKAGDTVEDRQDARDIRAALDWISSISEKS